MDYLIKVGAFVLVFGLLVVFHEFGHYAVARLMEVPQFRKQTGE